MLCHVPLILWLLLWKENKENEVITQGQSLTEKTT